MKPAVESSSIAIELIRDGFALDLSIEWSESVLVLFGASGSGKSTTLECVLGLCPEARCQIKLSGTWLEGGESAQRVPTSNRQLGWVPQSPTLFPHLDVAGNLSFGAGRAGPAGSEMLARAIAVLELGHLLDRSVDELSGGERSRVALGRALASGPRALLLDEPLAALDRPLRARIIPYLLRIRDEWRIPILYITHDPDEAMLLGGRVAVLDAGRIVATGPAREVLWSRAVLPVSEALGIENVIDAHADESSETADNVVVTKSGLRIRVPFSLAGVDAISLGLRAEDVLLSIDEPGRISARNVLAGSVIRCEPLAGETLVHIDVGEPLVAKLTPTAVQRLALVPGTPVYAVIKAHALHRLG